MQGDTLWKVLENMNCEHCFPQTSTSWSHMDGFWYVCNIRQPLPAQIQLCIQFTNSRSGYLIIMWPIKNVSTWGEKMDGVKTSIHKPQCLIFQDTCIIWILKHPKYSCTIGHTLPIPKCKIISLPSAGGGTKKTKDPTISKWWRFLT